MSKSSRRDGLDDCARKVSVCGYKRGSTRGLKFRYYQAADSKRGGLVGPNHLDSNSPLWELASWTSQYPVQGDGRWIYVALHWIFGMRNTVV
jgi:hypothetical protein